MALSNAILEKIRDEIGGDLDFANNVGDEVGGELGTLETIYTDADRGNYDVLRTAYICWRRRMNDHAKRGFDVTKGGSLLGRQQRQKELRRIVKEYEILVDTTHRSHNTRAITSDMDLDVAGSEF